jgi:hypothetical protein
MDFSQRKLGKLPFVPKAKDLKLAKYVDKAKLIDVARAPAAFDTAKLPTPSGTIPPPDRDPLFNNIAGCCVLTAFAKLAIMLSQLIGRPIVVTAEDVKRAYMRYGGYAPNRPDETDNGFVIRELLDICRRDGLFGVKVLAYALLGSDPDELNIATWAGMALLGGYALPLSAQTQVDATGRQLWYVPPGGFPSGQGPGSWGLHCIMSHKESPTIKGGSSWEEPDTDWTEEWDRQCCDERWLVITDVSADSVLQRAPNGFALEDLLADVRART